MYGGRLPAPLHFRNFLGPRGFSVCGEMNVAQEELTLKPAEVTCERCLQTLGRHRAENLGVPNDKNPKRKG